MLGFTGQNAGNVIAVIHHGDVIGSAVFFEDDPRPATPDVIAAIKAQPWRDGQLRTVTLGSLGSYRVSSQSAGADDQLVVGVSLDLANKTISPPNRQCHSAFDRRTAGDGGADRVGGRLCAAPVTPGRRDRRRGRRHARSPATIIASPPGCNRTTPIRTTRSASSGTP